MGVSSVILKDTAMIDLSSDTVRADKLLSGYTAHDASGAAIVGTYSGGGGGGGGGTGLNIKAVKSNFMVGLNSAEISWVNPSDAVGIEWENTKLYYKTESPPESADDGTLMYTSVTSAGEADSYSIENLESGLYYFMLVAEMSDGTKVVDMMRCDFATLEPVPLDYLEYELIDSESTHVISIHNFKGLDPDGDERLDYSGFSYLYIPDTYTIDNVNYQVKLPAIE